MSDVNSIIREGLWKNNPALVQLLGLCPLLAVTSTVTNALGLGFATMLVLIGSNLTVSLVRNWVPKDIRIPVFVMIIAAFVTVIQLLMNAYTFGLYQSLGIFIPLIVTNCVIIGRAEAFASKNTAPLSALDGFMMGLGFTAVLFVLGGMRELIGQGTLFDGANLLLGDWATVLRIEVLHFDNQLLVAILPPGAFLGLGLLIALKNIYDAKQKAQIAKAEVEKAPRVRVTSLS
ncbi:electron transport complex subunit E [Pseudoalteromonas xiamenensis]|uniref:Ion-translocating oxidoreductase complex subunit E n=1 Tax=Pseudoalteromonas xiamenensis TaxID=882626 RepID=A0A975DFZ8_9GAMM|nr:electron transport complex subunit E [Pseudoalteromonas xiamenensis]QTH71143.1 electron transport complex subunit E [Pseudoalteromonas xiamenensis]